MVTVLRTMPPELDPLWEVVEDRAAERHEVWARIEEVAAQIADARSRLSTTDPKQRDQASKDLAQLMAEATILPEQAMAAADTHALALHHWAVAGLEIVEEIEVAGKRAANEALDHERNAIEEFTAVRDGHRTYRDIDGVERKVGERGHAPTDPVAIRLAGAARADRARRDAQVKAQKLAKLLVDQTKVDGRQASIFPATPGKLSQRHHRPFGSVDRDGNLSGHERWRDSEGRKAAKKLEAAR